MELAVALAAEDAAGVQALRMLARHELRLVAVFTGPATGATGATVAAAAAGLDIPVLPAAAVTDPATADGLAEEGTDLLLNVHSLHIVAPEVLGTPKLGAFNLHPGPLPECAGLNSPSWALYWGAEEHGVTLHRMTPAVDEGAIAFEDRFEIGPEDTGLSVLTRCVRRGLPLVERLLDVAAAGEPIPAREQDLGRRRWFGHGPPDGGALDWDRPARRVVGFVRACDFGPFPSPWGWPRCTADGRQLAVAAAEVASGRADGPPGSVVAIEDDDALVAAADGLVRVGLLEVDGATVAAGAVLSAGQTLAAAPAETAA